MLGPLGRAGQYCARAWTPKVTVESSGDRVRRAVLPVPGSTVVLSAIDSDGKNADMRSFSCRASLTRQTSTLKPPIWPWYNRSADACAATHPLHLPRCP
jgi:hypothetical protein